VENVVAGQLLSRGGHHLFPTDDAHIVCVGKLLSSCVRVEGVHVVDCTPGQDNIIECFFERPHCEVHGADSKQGEGVNSNHDHEKEDVEEDLDKTNQKLSVKHENSFVLPRVFTMEVNGVEDILDQGVDNNSQEDGVFESKHQLDTCSFCQGGSVGMLYEKQVHRRQD